MTRHAASLVVACALLASASCSKKNRAPADPSDAGVEDVTPAADVELPEPPPVRLATPALLRINKLTADASAGTVLSPGTEEPIPLLALGASPCREGWALQPIFTPPGAREPDASESILIRLKELPLRPLSYVDPLDPARAYDLDLSSFDPDTKRIVGNITTGDGVTKTKGNTYTFDTIATDLAAGPDLGAFGCFTSGYYRVELPDGAHVSGPVVARWRAPNQYRFNLLLGEDVTLTVWAQIEQARKPLEPKIYDLAEVFANPNAFNFRVFVDRPRAVPLSARPDERAPYIESDALPLERGTMQLLFTQDELDGPIEIDLSEVTLPRAAPAPFADLTLSSVKMIAKPVTDARGMIVPNIRPPTWW
ncbi:MAG: hypothetical protein AAGI01_01910 [Myxococcota bacterium]